MSKALVFLALILTFPTFRSYSQTGSVSGMVTDSLTGLPVANLSVFIPFTSTGTTTNAQGEYRIEGIAPGDYTLMFRHVTYRPFSKSITVESGKQISLNVALAENTYQIDEVVKTGKIPDRSWAYKLFKEHFLGDLSGNKCFLQNPGDLKFYFDGDVLTAYAKKPLLIVNRYLGYRITYYLDYFKYVENSNPGKNSIKGAYYAFSGSAFYQDIKSNIRLVVTNWKLNRESEFRGSLKHFLACLYQNKLKENGYCLRKAYRGIKDMQKTDNLAASMAKIKMAQTDSVFTWDPEKSSTGFLHYIQNEDLGFPADRFTLDAASGDMIGTINEFLLVFNDFEKTPELGDDWLTTLKISGGKIIFDRNGNYRTPNGTLEWTNLDNAVRIKVMLPTDYQRDH